MGGAAKPIAKPVALNFKKTVEEMATRAAVEEAAERARTEAHEEYLRSIYPTAADAARRQRKEHDAYATYVRSSKESPYYEPDSQEMTYAGNEEEESDGEFNADLGSTRRRGDKGIW